MKILKKDSFNNFFKVFKKINNQTNTFNFDNKLTTQQLYMLFYLGNVSLTKPDKKISIMDIAKDLNIARYTASREISKLSTGFKYKTSDGKEGLFEGSNLVSVKSDEDQFNKLVSLTASGFKCINKLIV